MIKKEPGALSALATASRPEINSPCTLIWNATLVMTIIAPTACGLDSIGSSDASFALKTVRGPEIPLTRHAFFTKST